MVDYEHSIGVKIGTFEERTEALTRVAAGISRIRQQINILNSQFRQNIVSGQFMDAAKNVGAMRKQYKELTNFIKATPDLSEEQRAGMQKQLKSLRQNNKELSSYQSQLKSGIPIIQKGAVEQLKSTKSVMDANVSSMANTITQEGKLASATNRTAVSTKRFRMELLSVMFFGMAIERVFGGMIKQALESTGILDLLSAALLFLLLPIIMDLIPLIIGFSEAIFNMDENTRRTVGTIILVLGVFGALLAAFGMLGLGIKGLEVLLGTGAITAALTSIGDAGVVAFASLGIGFWEIIILLAILAIAFSQNSDNIISTVNETTDIIGTLFSGLGDILVGVFHIIRGLVTGNAQEFLDGLEQVFIYGFAKIGYGILGIMYNVVKVLVDLFFGLVTAVGNAFSIVGDIGAKLTDKLGLDQLTGFWKDFSAATKDIEPFALPSWEKIAGPAPKAPEKLPVLAPAETTTAAYTSAALGLRPYETTTPTTGALNAPTVNITINADTRDSILAALSEQLRKYQIT